MKLDFFPRVCASTKSRMVRSARRPSPRAGYVFFKHEESGIGPKLAQQLTELTRAAAR